MGVAILEHGGKVLNFRTDPNKINWTYRLNTKVEETYGGRVVQVLSASIDDLVVTADAGSGGWIYMRQVAEFFRDMLFDQREGGEPGLFSFPGRGWEMRVYALAFPYKDRWDDVRREFTMNFKVQEDVSGVVSSSVIANELAKLKQGVGYEKTVYNDPDLAAEQDDEDADGDTDDTEGTDAKTDSTTAGKGSKNSMTDAILGGMR